MEAKQYATESMDHWRNQRGNQKIPRDKWKWKHNDPKPMGCSKSSSKREVYSNTILPQEMKEKKAQINNLNLHLKQLGKEELTKAKVSRTEEIIKIRVEINEIEIFKNSKDQWN